MTLKKTGCKEIIASGMEYYTPYRYGNYHLPSNFLFSFSKTPTNVIQIILAIAAVRSVKIHQEAMNVSVRKDLN